MDLGFNLAQSNRDLKDPTSRQNFGDTSGLLCKNDLIPCHMELVHCAPDDSSLSVNNSHQNVNPPVPFRCLQWFNQRIQVRRPPYRACVHSVVWINCHSPGGLGNSLVLKIREGAGLLQEDGHLGGICICSSLLLRPPYHPNHGQQVGLLQKL